MPTIDWAFLCDYAFVDAAGKASIIGTFDNINAVNLPMKHPQLFIALGMKFSQGDDFVLSSKISSPTGLEIAKTDPQRITVPTNAPSAKAVITLAYYGTQFSETGEYHIEIFIDNNSVHFIPVEIKLLTRKT